MRFWSVSGLRQPALLALRQICDDYPIIMDIFSNCCHNLHFGTQRSFDILICEGSVIQIGNILSMEDGRYAIDDREFLFHGEL